jgi:3-hydroxybutyryl-CoA dehydrogenase
VPAKKDEPRKINPELAAMIEEARAASPAFTGSRPFSAHRVILPMFNEAVYALQEHVVEAADVDVAMQWGTGMSKGLLTIAEGKGLAWCLSELESYQSVYGERFRPSWLLRKMVSAGVRDFAGEKAPLAVR